MGEGRMREFVGVGLQYKRAERVVGVRLETERPL